MAKSQITIIGLGLAGASLGLTLRQGDGDFEIVGHDKSPDVAGNAKRMGAVDRTEWNLHRACTGAGLVIIDTPLAELEEVLGHIAEDLSSGAVVVALTEVMQPALAIGAAALKNNAFVAAHPILNRVGGELEARADLFANSQFCIGSHVETQPAALELINNLAIRATATPYRTRRHHLPAGTDAPAAGRGPDAGGQRFFRLAGWTKAGRAHLCQQHRDRR